ncbi:MAG TPA: ion transporter, partial [Gammaproteobacteria bacterium]|nr:ion transporter [Gammaproteobacteria bacterium]
IIIFEADTAAGRRFDVALIALILLSVLTVMLDSVPQIHAKYGRWLYVAEWTFTLLFTVEYLTRLWCI